MSSPQPFTVPTCSHTCHDFLVVATYTNGTAHPPRFILATADKAPSQERATCNISGEAAARVPPFVPHMSLDEAHQLKVDDKVDHRDTVGRFVLATVMEKQGTNLKIHYVKWSRTWDVWSDFTKELHRFAAAGSIFKRKARRFVSLKKGDYVDINPKCRHPGWKCGQIRFVDERLGEVQVVYEQLDKNYLYWALLDDSSEIAEFGTKAITTEDGPDNTIELDEKKERKSKMEIKERLSAMTFSQYYIAQAFQVYEQNYGRSFYDLEMVTEIAICLMEKDTRGGGNLKKWNRREEFKKAHSEDVHQLKGQNERLKTKVRVLEDVQNELLLTIASLKEENRVLRLSALDNAGYSTWSGQQFIEWIISIDPQVYSQYAETLTASFHEELVTGECIDEIEAADVKRWGIINFTHMSRLMREIQGLVGKQRKHEIEGARVCSADIEDIYAQEVEGPDTISS